MPALFLVFCPTQSKSSKFKLTSFWRFSGQILSKGTGKLTRMSNGGSIKFIHEIISFEMSCCEKKTFRFMCLSAKLVCAWFHFFVQLVRSRENEQWSRNAGIFQFPCHRLKTDSFSSPSLKNDKCSGKALKIDDLIKTALHTKSVGEEELGTW